MNVADLQRQHVRDHVIPEACVTDREPWPCTIAQLLDGEGAAMTALTPEQRAAPCEFVPPNEPWSCRTHPGGLRTSLDEEQCDVARPAEPFNDAYLDNIRASLAEGKRLQGHYIIRRLLATLDAQRESALLAIAEPGEAGPPLREAVIVAIASLDRGTDADAVAEHLRAAVRGGSE